MYKACVYAPIVRNEELQNIFCKKESNRQTDKVPFPLKERNLSLLQGWNKKKMHPTQVSPWTIFRGNE